MIHKNEFSSIVKLDDIGAGVSVHSISANEQECAALAQRFDLIQLDQLSATISLSKTPAGIAATGTVTAKLVQACIATAQPVPAEIHETIAILFVEEPTDDGEVELEAEECDTMFHDGRGVDIGEAAAQTLILSLDPYPRSPNAETILRAAGVQSDDDIEAPAGPFAALAALKNKLER
jgi:uncharacterized metal-binding protein YceD (DUF177 family)